MSTPKSTEQTLIARGWVRSPSGALSHPARVGAGGHTIAATATVAWPKTKRLRQRTKPEMNNLEIRFYQRQRALFPGRTFLAQSVRFKLANGIWYKPDLFCLEFDPPTAWEVKGPHSFRGGFENLKVAAHCYPGIRWLLVWEENGAWAEQVILP